MKRYGLIFLSTVFLFTGAAKASEPAISFELLKNLVGIWKLKNKSSDFRISFELTAADSVVVETWISKDKKHSLTLYHLDGERLIATHYCPQGNQPRLQMTTASTNLLEFEFFDATNLTSPAASHQDFLSLKINDTHTELERKEIYRGHEQSSKSTLIFVREQSPESSVPPP